MRRAVITLAVLLMAVASLGVVGCGGDTATAKQYMKEADQAVADLQEKTDKMSEEAYAGIMPLLSGNTSEVNLDQLTAMAGEVPAIEKEIDAVIADYKKITKLNGVDDYVAYANAMIDYLETMKSALQEQMKMMETLMPAIQQAVATGDISSIMTQMTTASTGVTEISTELEEKKDAADKIKKDKKLGE